MEFDRNQGEQWRDLLCRLGSFIQQKVLAARDTAAEGEMAIVAEVTRADTIYRIDKVSEEAVLGWLAVHWPPSQPVELVMEGLEDKGPTIFPARFKPEQTLGKLILDPIDGTRCIMFDKRPAWVLAAIAPQKGEKTRLADTVAAAMTELPHAKQRLADQISAVRGCGPQGIISERVNLLDGTRRSFRLRPSPATNFRHGFASFARAMPEAKGLLAQFEEELWKRLLRKDYGKSLVFDDQYLSTGGQFYEVLSGHDRMQGDLRPLAYRKLGLAEALPCHPYDVGPLLLLEEAGCIIEAPDGSPLDIPFDTVTPITWVAYANSALAAQVRPVMQKLLTEFF